MLLMKYYNSALKVESSLSSLGAHSSFSTLNLVHASDSPESAKREMDLYFKEEELCPNYKNMFEMVLDELGD